MMNTWVLMILSKFYQGCYKIYKYIRPFYSTYLILLTLAGFFFLSVYFVKKSVIKKSIKHIQELVLQREAHITSAYKNLTDRLTELRKDEAIKKAFFQLKNLYNKHAALNQIDHKNENAQLKSEQQAVTSFQEQLVPNNHIEQSNKKTYKEAVIVHRTKLARLLLKLNVENMFFIDGKKDSFFVQNPDGAVALSMQKNLKNNPILSLSMQRACMQMSTDISQFLFNKETGKTSLFISIPLIEKERLEGLIVVQIHDLLLSKLLQDYSDMGKTGEVLIGQKTDQGVIFITPLRFEQANTFKKRVIKQESTAIPIKESTSGIQASGISIDYRDIPVVASWRYVQEFDWGLVVKQDLAEVLQPYASLFFMLYCFGFFMLFFCIMLLLPLCRYYINLFGSLYRALWVLLILSLLSAALFFYAKKRSTYYTQRAMHEYARSIANKGLKKINKQLTIIRHIAQEMADDIGVGKLSGNDVGVYAKRRLQEQKSLERIMVFYDPCIHFQSSSRTDKGIEFTKGTITEEYFLGNNEFNAWLNEIKEKGEGWFDAYQKDGDTITSAFYAVPFYYDNDKKQSLKGIVVCFCSLKDIKNFAASIGLGKTGYGFVLAKDGQFIYHSLEKYVQSSKTIFDLANELDDEGLRTVAQKSQQQESGVTRYKNEFTGQSSDIYFEPIKQAGWTLGLVLIEEEILIPTNLLKRLKTSILISLIIVFILIVLLSTGVGTAQASSYSQSSIGISIILAIGMFVLWNVLASVNVIDKLNDIKIFDQFALNGFLNSMQRKHGSRIIPIKTGLFIQTIDFPDLNHVKITGNIWQKFEEKNHDHIMRGFVLPQATKISMEQDYEVTKNGITTIGWNIRCEFFQENVYSRYPFDMQEIEIYFEPKDKENNVILVPDLSSYRIISPTTGPGIDDNLQLASFTLKRSFFSYEPYEAETNYGINYYRDKISDALKLKFTAHVARNALNSFICFLLPLLVALFTLFAILWTTEIRLRKNVNVKISFSAVGGPYAAIFFPMIFLHNTLRSSFQVNEVLYMEYFFLFTYLNIFLLILHAISLSSTGITTSFKHQSCKIILYLFWPFNLLMWLITTIFMFY